MKTIIVSDKFAVARRLEDFGLGVDNLLVAVRAGFTAWESCTELDPRMFPGLSMFAVAVRHLRMELAKKGWTKCDDGNYSLTIAGDKSVAIGVSLGDGATGLPELSPSTKSPKGTRTMDALVVNNLQLGFDFEIPDGYRPRAIKESYVTWLLLMHRTEDKVFSELSHPLDFDEKKRVNVWRERIILPSIDIAPIDQFDIGTDDGVTIDVSVRRRM